MINIFSDDMRRNPFPAYAQIRATSPLLRIPPPFDAWAVFDYEGVKRVMSDHETFSSKVPAPRNWFLFQDPPMHTKSRALISKAFTPGSIPNLEPRIKALSRELLEKHLHRDEMDLAADFSVPLPMIVIAEMIGFSREDWPRLNRWSEVILQLSHTRSGSVESAKALADFGEVTVQMGVYLESLTSERRAAPRDDLLTRLVQASVGGECLTCEELVGFVQLLILAGQETTTNLINNAVLCFLEHPEELARVRKDLSLLPGAIEEVLRYRSSFLWMMRTPRREVELRGQVLSPGELVLVMVASANHDPAQFPDPERFDVGRAPNAHLAFGHGIHFCIGAPLARMEARIALTDILELLPELRLADAGPWEPRKALHVHGPNRLRVRFTAAKNASA
jgi:cytochrome P450